METRVPPSLLNRIIGPPLFLAGGFAAAFWFFYRIVCLLEDLSSPVILFDKGSYYMLGVGLGLLSLGIGLAKEFWGGNPLTAKQADIISKLGIAGVVLIFIIPHISHFSADYYLKNQGYSVCEEASHQWLFVRDIVYIQPTVECSEDLKKN